MNKETILSIENINKSFPGTKALSDVSLTLKKGEVHAIIGENGAGKSTLMNIISGIHQADSGQIYIDKEEVNIKNPRDAQELGIGFVHQEIALCPDLTVAENIFIKEINRSNKLLVDYSELFRRAQTLIDFFETDIDVKEKVYKLSISEQQIVEIARSLSSDAQIIIFDEPSTSLTETECENLFEIISDLKSEGISILYISHKLSEIFEICDRATVLRDGHYIDTCNVSDVNEETLVNKMIGREISDLYPDKNGKSDEVLFKVNDLNKEGQFNDIDFELKKGEVLGFAGLVGAGRSELVKMICGLDQKDEGDIYLDGKEIKINNYREAIKNGIVYLTEDRKEEGLFLNKSIKDNVSALNLEQVSKGFLIDRRKEEKQAWKYFDELNVKANGIKQKTLDLSGGNQQKVLISKLLSVSPRVLFMDEPTRGIDVGAKAEIHKLLRELANNELGVVVISSELPEIIGMCDRVLCMYEGEICGEVIGDDINEENIMYYCAGLGIEA